MFLIADTNIDTYIHYVRMHVPVATSEKNQKIARIHAAFYEDFMGLYFMS